MERLKLATVWLSGCSGCYMSFLDLDEWLIDLAEAADLVYSPFIDNLLNTDQNLTESKRVTSQVEGKRTESSDKRTRAPDL